MDNYKETFDTWNKIASLYEDKFMHLDLYNETYDFICKTLNTNTPKLLEIGCGPGNITRYLLTQRPDFSITGIDVAPNMIELAKKNNPSATFTIMDAREIHQLNTTFDAIICGFCIPYLSEQDCLKLISDCKNLLTPSGLLYISFVEGNTNESGFKLGSSGDRTYFYYHKLDVLEKILSDHSFELTKTFKINYPKGDGNMEVHTVVIAKMKIAHH